MATEHNKPAVIGASRRQVLGGLAAAPFVNLAAPSGGAQPSRAEVAVVGAGVFGCWTAWHLAKRGRRVLLIDAYGPGNSRASSGGESRVIRAGYGEDAVYSRWVRKALPQWKALSRRQNLPLCYESGVLWFSQRRDRFIAGTVETLNRLAVPMETLDRPALEERYGQIAFDDIALGLFEPEAGALMARRAVQALAKELTGMDVAVLRAAAGRPEERGTGVTIPLEGANAVQADAAVYACGPWLAGLFPEAIGKRILPTRQEVFFFGAGKGDTRFQPAAMPVWADYNGGDVVYGTPDLESRGFKIAFDAHGPSFDPDSGNRQVSEAGVARARGYLARRFPPLADAPLLESRVCQYENTAGGDFLIDRHPEMDGVWLVGGGSGHGFKHGPALGAYVAERLTDGAEALEPRFKLETKSPVEPG